MRRTLEHFEPRFDVQEMSVTTQNKDYEDANNYAHAHVFRSLLFHVVLRVVSLALGFHVVIGVGRFNVQQDGFVLQLHFTTQAQSSLLLDVVVRLSCHRPLNLYPKLLHVSHRENGSFEVIFFKMRITTLAQWRDHWPTVLPLQQNPTCLDPTNSPLVASISFRIKLHLSSPVFRQIFVWSGVTRLFTFESLNPGVLPCRSLRLWIWISVCLNPSLSNKHSKSLNSAILTPRLGLQNNATLCLLAPSLTNPRTRLQKTSVQLVCVRLVDSVD